MQQYLKDLPQTLAQLSDHELWQQTSRAALKEKSCTAVVIAHLAEVDKRKLHLLHACKSLFDYCSTVLGYSEAESYLRCQVARACSAHPQLLGELAAGTMSLCVAGKVASKLHESNQQQLLKACSGKTKVEAEKIIATLHPQEAPKTLIRKQSLSPASSEPQARRPEIKPIAHDTFAVKVSINEALLKKLERLAEVLGISSVKSQLPELLEKVADIALQVKDPALKPENKPATKKPSPPASESTKSTEASKRSRYVSVKTRRKIFADAQYQCQYVSPDGKRCRQKTHLQVDHIQAFAKNGSNEPENLMVLCQAHNLWKAEREFGKDKTARATRKNRDDICPRGPR